MRSCSGQTEVRQHLTETEVILKESRPPEGRPEDSSIYKILYRSEGVPERDIWFLGVMLQGSNQMERVLGKPPSPPPPPPSVGD